MQVTLILEFSASYCYLARGIAQVYLLYFLNSEDEILCLCITVKDKMEQRCQLHMQNRSYHIIG